MCLKCGSALSSFTDCPSCGSKWSETHSDIPVLLEDWQQHQNEIESKQSGNTADWYTEAQLEASNGPYRHHINRRKNYLRELLARLTENRKISKLMDLGCGDGSNLTMLRPFAETLLGCDYNLLRLKRAKNLDVADQLFCADFRNLPILSESLDVVFCHHVLEHIVQDKAALSEILRVLRPDGKLILGVPNEGAWFWQLAYRLQPATRENTDHVQFYTRDSLNSLCKDVGFTIKEEVNIGWGVPHWGIDARLRKYKPIESFLESAGKTFFPSQCTSLYSVLSKSN